MTSKEMARLLKENGFIEIKTSGGSHRKFQNPLTKKTVIVPFHNKDLGKRFKTSYLETSWAKISPPKFIKE